MRTLLVLVGLASSTTLWAQVRITTAISGDAATGNQLIQTKRSQMNQHQLHPKVSWYLNY
ncbi:hypothetical protein [Spirosoma koreense]